jgi:hypothetical protein
MLVTAAHPAAAEGGFGSLGLKRFTLSLHLGAVGGLGDVDGRRVGAVVGAGLGLANYHYVAEADDDAAREATREKLRIEGWKATADRARHAQAGWTQGRPPESPTVGAVRPCEAPKPKERGEALTRAGALMFEWNEVMKTWNVRASALLGLGDSGLGLGLSAGVAMRRASFEGVSLRVESEYDLWQDRWPGLAIFASFGSDTFGTEWHPLGLMGLRMALFAPRIW